MRKKKTMDNLQMMFFSNIFHLAMQALLKLPKF